MKKLSRRSMLKGAAAVGSLAALGMASAQGGAAKANAKATPAPTPTAKAGAGKKILIMGGTGFLGPALVDAARKRGHTLTLFNRGKTRPGLFSEAEIEQLHGDRDGKMEALAGDRRWDVVIDTSGYVPRIVKQSVDLLAPRVEQYIFISSISVYADVSKPGLDETGAVETVPDEKSEEVRKHYGGLKALCEKTVAQVAPDKTTVIRPGLIVGPGDPTDRFSYWPLRIARGGEVLAPGDGKDPVQIIDVRDLAEWTIGLVERRVLGTFNATGPVKAMPMKDMLAGCLKGTGGNAKLTWVPASFLEEQKVAPWQDMPAWLPATGETAGSGLVSNARAVKQGLRFRPVTDTAKDTVAWFKTLPADRQAKPRAGLTPERETEVLKAWHARKTK
jgi:2'-hydroxyisoflavone reductase